MASATLIAVSTLATAGGQVHSALEQRQAGKAQERAARDERRKAALQNARQRRRAAAEAQVARAQVEAQGAAQGDVSGSGTAQAIGAIESQTAGNISFQRTQEGINDRIISNQRSAQRSLNSAQFGQSIASLPSQFGLGAGSLIRQKIGGAD